MKAYVVTEGSYSSYHVIAVFTTRRKARQFITTLCRDASIETYDLDVPIPQEYKAGLRKWTVNTHYDSMAQPFLADWSDRVGERLVWWDKSKGIRVLTVVAFAKDEKHAIKIANEKRAQWIVEKKWKWNG